MKPICLVLSYPSEELDCGASRFWRGPDLPKGFGYPTYTDAEGTEYPYSFICQINLAELAHFAPENPLPHTGLLSFFAKIDHYMGYFDAPDSIGGIISERDAVKVMYFPSCENMEETIVLDDDDNEMSPAELRISFSYDVPDLSDEHKLFAYPSHREWETWEHPYEDRIILLQIDSFCGKDFNLNFMDCGVLDFLISPSELKKHCFDDVRAIVLST